MKELTANSESYYGRVIFVVVRCHLKKRTVQFIQPNLTTFYQNYY